MPDKTPSDYKKELDLKYLDTHKIMLLTVTASIATRLTIRSISGREPRTQGGIWEETLRQIDETCSKGQLGLEYAALHHNFDSTY